MNLKKLKAAEAEFLARYPGGFSHPEMLAIGKKHKMGKMITLAQAGFARENFKDPGLIIENMIKVVSRSSMVSVFEKPKFRDFAAAMAPRDRGDLVRALENQLYGNQQEGFEAMLEILKSVKLGKWTLMTICPVYFRPQEEVFVKPTTAKGVIEVFELAPLQYKATPTWAFYEEYRNILNEMKTKVDSSLAPDNAAFSGFLMFSLE